MTAVMRQAAIDLLGAENVLAIKPRTWSEDFSMFAEVVPGAFAVPRRRNRRRPSQPSQRYVRYRRLAIMDGNGEVLAETAKLIKHLETKK